MKKYRWLIWLIIIVAAGVAVWYWKFREKEVPVVLETETPQMGYISNSVTATGTIQPVDTVSVGTQVSGTISAVYADFNSTVKKGQLIAEIDKSLFLAQVQQISANLQQAKSNVVFQESNFNRQKKLFDLGAISRAEYENALYQRDIAKDNVTSVASQLDAANRNLSFASIYSPMDGTIMARNVSVGQTVAASFNTPTLFVIARDLTKMQVRASVDEADIGNVKNGQRVTFTVDAFPDETFEGNVKDVRLQASVAANVVTYITLVDAPNDDMKLKPGMTASITLFTKEVPNTMLISSKAIKFKPDSAIMKKYTIEDDESLTKKGTAKKQPGGAVQPDTTKPLLAKKAEKTDQAIVWIKKDSTISSRIIETGLNDNANVQVLSGLKDGEIVVSGVLQPGEEKAAGTAARSPFMPARRGGGGSRSGGGRQ
ncbi:MAG: efflux RND transporter periplasmic adaptor subunit [Chitinophagaceae bacterium]|nr:MAG: efflux RND transporter periplasmic adaptor subunit [Chitinophagaceae bacterium]